MKWALLAVAVLVALVGVVALVGACLPRKHVASARARFSRPPTEVFEALVAVEKYPSWRSGVRAVERLALEGVPGFREVGSNGRVTYAFDQVDAPRKLVLRIADDDLPYGGTWTFALLPDGAGTQLTITEDGEVKPVIFRALARFAFGHHATMLGYLRDLGRELGEQVEPERTGGA